jgi:cephalosporin hydroxylase
MKDTFYQDRTQSNKKLGASEKLKELSIKFIEESAKLMYSYNFDWFGRPIIQYPQDIVAMQELIWDIKPDLIIETGIARGGSLTLYASILEAIGHGEVLGIDIDIREHNREKIEKHPLAKRITMLEGSSVSEEIIKQVESQAKGKDKILVILDSNHTHEHVLKELELYHKFVTKGSYLVVFDTIIEYMSSDFFQNRPWGVGNNPMTAVDEFLKTSKDFEIDESIDNKLLISVAPRGYLKRI